MQVSTLYLLGTGSLSQFFGQLAMATPEELNRCLEVALDVARSAGKVSIISLDQPRAVSRLNAQSVSMCMMCPCA